MILRFRKFWLFQTFFWFAAGAVLVVAYAMEMPLEFARARGITGALAGLAVSFLLSFVLVRGRGKVEKITVAGLIILALGLVGTALSNLTAFVILGINIASLQWVYFFQGWLRLALLLILWCGVYGYLQSRREREDTPESLISSNSNKEFPEYLAVERGGNITLLPVAEILFLSAADEYVAVTNRDGEYLRRGSLKSLEGMLDPKSFYRVHRSTIVNLSHVRELEPRGKGDYVIILKDGQRLRASRRYRSGLHERVTGMA